MRNRNSITQGFRADVTTLVSNRNYLVLQAVFTLMMCVYIGLAVFLDQIFDPFFSSTAFVAVIGSTFLLFGSAASQAVGWYLDKTNRYLFTLRILLVGSCLFMASSLFLFPTENPYLVIGWAIMAGIAIVPITVLLFNFMTETTHPLAPALVINAAWMIENLTFFGFNVIVLSILAGYELDPAKGSMSVLLAQNVCAVLALLLSCFAKEDLRR